MAKYRDHSNGGVEVDLDPNDSKTKWLVANGYMSKVSERNPDSQRGEFATSTPAKDDPTLAENREAPTPVDKQTPHLANVQAEADEPDEGDATPES